MTRVGLLAALVVIAGAFEIARPGYAVDEEFTDWFAYNLRHEGTVQPLSRRLEGDG